MDQLLATVKGLDTSQAIGVATAAFLALAGLVRSLNDLFGELTRLWGYIARTVSDFGKKKVEDTANRIRAKQLFRDLINQYTSYYARGARAFGVAQRDALNLAVEETSKAPSFAEILRNDAVHESWADLTRSMMKVAEEMVEAGSTKRISLKSNHTETRKHAKRFCKLAFPELASRLDILERRFDKDVTIEFARSACVIAI